MIWSNLRPILDSYKLKLISNDIKEVKAEDTFKKHLGSKGPVDISKEVSEIQENIKAYQQILLDVDRMPNDEPGPRRADLTQKREPAE